MASWYIETSSSLILISKRWYYWYLSKYRRYRTILQWCANVVCCFSWKTCTFYLRAGTGMSVSSNEANRLNSQSGKSLPDADEMRHHSFAPSQLTLSIYHRLTLFAVFCLSLSASAMLIFLLLFWYCGGIFLLCALITALLGELHCRLSLSS